MFDRIKALWKRITHKDEPIQSDEKSVFGETRHIFQPFYEGKEDVAEVFDVEVPGTTSFWGMEVGGIIFYFKFFSNDGENCLVWMIDDRMAEVVDGFSKMSQARLEKLGEEKYCPTIVRLMKDCVEDRYDRGALVKLYDHFGYVICIPFRYSRYLDNKDYIGLYEEMTNGIVIDSSLRLIKQIAAMHDEMEKFDGLSTWDEVKVSVKEALPGAKIGWQISRLLSSIIG